MNYIIKLLRVQHMYSQQQVADYLSVCQKTYSDYETGNTRISLEILIKLAKLYNVDMNYITGLSKQAKPFPKE